MVDVAIAGGGPSGMAAALEIKKHAPELKVVILEKNEAVGRKLRATGNGRCNIANTECEGYALVSDFLMREGIAFRVYENGLVYPFSESAADVTDRFEERLKESEVRVKTGYEVKTVERGQKGFVINGSIECRYLVLALGGKAGPAFGTIGDGYRLARKLGHSVVTPVPILTPVEIDGFEAKGLNGIRARGRVSLIRKGDTVYSETGEIQFTKYGLSGICIFNMTRHMRYDKEEGLSCFRIRIDLDPERLLDAYVKDEIRRAVEKGESAKSDNERKKAKPYESAEVLLRTAFRPALSREIVRQAGIPDGMALSEFDDEAAEAVISSFRALEFVPSGIRGWKDAQCTMGGISLEEVDDDTSQSRLVDRLYITGELLDYDGPCGGYNLANAWLTGIKAGKAIADDALQN
ncbi:MAG: aminoacetone oxidase family FAD-binding enzyme [Firmicutes bacterium]|nr:aminoacetone oxidase family FAD-binding enzyme [Bacillota bacterium]